MLNWQLRNCLQKRYTFPCKLNYSDYDYIQGLVDAEIPDADKLLKLIESCDELDCVELDIEC